MEFLSNEKVIIGHVHAQFLLIAKPFFFCTILKQTTFGFKSGQSVQFLEAARRLPVVEFSLTVV
jgi:hypothetical protein